MRALLTGGIKAILAIAALSTGAHWALRVQRDAPVLAGLPEPTTTGSIEPRRIDRPAAVPTMEARAPDPRLPEARAARAAPPGAGFDQTHLAALVAGTVKAPASVRVASTANVASPVKGVGEARPAAKPVVKGEAKVEAKGEPKAASKPVARGEAGGDARSSAKPVARPDAKPAAKSDAKPDAKPAAKPVAKVEARADAKP